MKIKFNSGGSFPSNKLWKLQSLTIIVRSVFQKKKQVLSTIFLDECLYEL